MKPVKRYELHARDFKGFHWKKIGCIHFLELLFKSTGGGLPSYMLEMDPPDLLEFIEERLHMRRLVDEMARTMPTPRKKKNVERAKSRKAKRANRNAGLGAASSPAIPIQGDGPIQS